MKACAVIRTIPEPWAQKIGRDRPRLNLPNENFELLRQSQKVAKWAYEKMLMSPTNLDIDSCHRKWQAELNLADPIQWPEIYENLHNCTTDVNLKWIHYQCIKRTLPTNRLLYLYGITESDKCIQCPIYSETVFHKFWQCPTVRTLWRELRNVLNLEREITRANVLVGTTLQNTRNAHIASSIILLTKQYIWRHREQSGRINFVGLKNHIRGYLEVEKYISRITGREHKFRDQWGQIWERLHQHL